MHNVKIFNKNSGLFLLLTFYLFSRIGLLMPIDRFGIRKIEPYFYVSSETVVFIILLLLFSFLAVFLVFKVHNSFGETPAVILFLAISEPVFFTSLDNCLKLTVTVLGILCLLNTTRDKPYISNSITICLFVFVSVLLVPHYLMSYVPLALSFFIVSSKKKNNKVLGGVISSAVCALAALLINKILYDSASLFTDIIDTFSFSQSTSYSKSFNTFIATIPMTVVGAVFYNKYLKKHKSLIRKSKKGKAYVSDSQNEIFVLDLMGVIFVVAAIGLAFFKSDAFFTINIIPFIMALAMIYSHNEVCLAVLDDLSEYIKNHKIIAAAVLIAIYYISLSAIDNYYVGYKLIEYIRY